LAPAAIALTLVRPLTVTGTCALVRVLFPSCPELFSPEHFTDPDANSAHVCAAPAAILGGTAAAVIPASVVAAPAGTVVDTNPAPSNTNDNPTRPDIDPCPTMTTSRPRERLTQEAPGTLESRIRCLNNLRDEFRAVP